MVFTVINFVLIQSCSKHDEKSRESQSGQTDSTAEIIKTINYVIPAGAHYAIPTSFDSTSKSQLIFTALFDSSCIYTTVSRENQNDINKLYGFSDCDSPHLVNSARIGWRWSDDSLRLFGYVHNNGVILSKEIVAVSIG